MCTHYTKFSAPTYANLEKPLCVFDPLRAVTVSAKYYFEAQNNYYNHESGKQMLKAISQSNQLPNTTFNHFRVWWVALKDAETIYQQRRARYKETYKELSALSDRDLADMGTSRSNIAKLAKEEAMKVGAK